MKDLCYNLLQSLIFTFCLIGFVWIIEGELAKFAPLPLNGGGRGLTQHMMGSPSLISQTDCLRLV